MKRDYIAESKKYGDAMREIAEALEDEVVKLRTLSSGIGQKTNVSEIERGIEITNKVIAETFKGLGQEQVTELQEITNKILTKQNVTVRLTTPQMNSAEIKRATEHSLETPPKIYKNGRKVIYRDYMEMKTRTDAQNEMLDQSNELAKVTRQLFVICDSYSDCADDHAEYQGQVYYYEDALAFWQQRNPELYQRIMAKIREKKMMSVEKVTKFENKHDIGLCRRYNCRHTLTPIPIFDVLDMSDAELDKEHGVHKGAYKSENYQASQTQRKLENLLRRTKRNAAISQQLFDRTGLVEHLELANKYKFQTRYLSSDMRKLVKAFPNLKRDYRRESPFRIQEDYGFHYNKLAPISEVVEEFKTELENNEITSLEPRPPIHFKIDIKSLPPSFHGSKAMKAMMEKGFKTDNEVSQKFIENIFDNLTTSKVEFKLERKTSSNGGQFAYQLGRYPDGSYTLVDQTYSVKASSATYTGVHEATHGLDARIGLIAHRLKGERSIPTMYSAQDQEFATAINGLRAKLKNDYEFRNEVYDMLVEGTEITEETKTLSNEFEDAFKMRPRIEKLNVKLTYDRYNAKQEDYDEYNGLVDEFNKRMRTLSSKDAFNDQKATHDIVSALINGGDEFESGKGIFKLRGSHDISYYSRHDMRATEILACYVGMKSQNSPMIAKLKETMPEIVDACDNLMVKMNDLREEYIKNGFIK